MDTYYHFRKGLAVGIILLFVGLAVAPCASALRNKPNQLCVESEAEKIPVTIYENFRPSLLRHSIKEISQQDAFELQEKLTKVNDPQAQLSILASYGIVQKTMVQTALQNTNELKRHQVSFSFRADSFINRDCDISCFGFVSLGWPIFPLFLLFAPVGVFITGSGNFTVVNGTLPDWSVSGSLIGMVVGFVGIWINILVFNVFIGHAAYVNVRYY